MKEFFFFLQLFDIESFTYTYVLGCPQTRQAVVIDPVDIQVSVQLFQHTPSKTEHTLFKLASDIYINIIIFLYINKLGIYLTKCIMNLQGLILS